MVKFVDKLIKDITSNNIKKLIQVDCPLEFMIKAFKDIPEEEIMEIYKEVKNEQYLAMLDKAIKEAEDGGFYGEELNEKI